MERYKTIAIELLEMSLATEYEIAERKLKDGIIKNERGINEEDFLDEYVEGVIYRCTSITPEELDKLIHGEEL